MYTKEDNQQNQIVRYMRKHGSITQLEALQFGCLRLAAQIANLRKAGFDILAERVKVEKADGTNVSVARYSLLGDCKKV